MEMKQKLIRLSQSYAAALAKHLKPGPGASLRPALRLGRRAVALGLETLELARIHERALVKLECARAKNGVIKRAQAFFTEAIIPIVETHRAARDSKAAVNRLTKALGRRTTELAVTHGKLQRGIVRYKAMEDVSAKNGKFQDKCLGESLRLQERLRKLTHQVMAAQEDERRHISNELRDEIAQTLVGINVRLLCLKEGSRSNLKGLKNDIASAQRLVVNSAKSVRRFARQLEIHHFAQRDPGPASR